MKLRNVILSAVCALALSAGLNAQGSCQAYQLAGTYAVTYSGWTTVGVVNNIPASVPAVGVGIATIDEKGALSTSVTAMFAGNPLTMTVSGKVEVTSDCKLTIKASCAEGCTWTLAGVFVRSSSMFGNSPKEAHLVVTSQTSDGVAMPTTTLLNMKQIGN